MKNALVTLVCCSVLSTFAGCPATRLASDGGGGAGASGCGGGNAVQVEHAATCIGGADGCSGA